MQFLYSEGLGSVGRIIPSLSASVMIKNLAPNLKAEA
jgi:hypothetical protein